MGFENHEFEPEQGPSWARPNWPLSDTDDLTAALDPTQMQVAVKQAAKAAGKPMAQADVAAAAADSIRAMMLIRTYRVRGHLAANLDPLGLTKQDLPADLTPEYHGFTGADLDRQVARAGCLVAGLQPGLGALEVRHGWASLPRSMLMARPTALPPEVRSTLSPYFLGFHFASSCVRVQIRFFCQAT